MRVRHTDRGFDRLVNFSDAVVAIAITLLVLPLTDLVADPDPHGVWSLIADNAGAFWAYGLSFLVLASYWLVHHRMFEGIGDYDGGLAWTNVAWLFAIVSLPFTTELIQSYSFAGGSGLLYCLNLAAISFLLTLIGWRVQRDPTLQSATYAPATMRMGKSVVYACYFVGVGLVSLINAPLAPWLLLGLFPVGMVLDRQDPDAAL